MLGRGEHSARLNPADEGRNEPRDGFGILAVAANVDDGIGGCQVHVRDGRVDLVDPDRARLLRDDPALPLGERRIAGCRDGHRPGPDGRVGEPHSDARLEVGRDHERFPGERLETAIQAGRLGNVREEVPQDPPDPVVADLVHERAVFRGGLVHEATGRRC